VSDEDKKEIRNQLQIHTSSGLLSLYLLIHITHSASLSASSSSGEKRLFFGCLARGFGFLLAVVFFFLLTVLVAG